MGQGQLIRLTLDVSKANRRILIHPDDRGLLCFHVREKLYQCITLNFWARASGWYWAVLQALYGSILACSVVTVPCGSMLTIL